MSASSAMRRGDKFREPGSAPAENTNCYARRSLLKSYRLSERYVSLHFYEDYFSIYLSVSDRRRILYYKARRRGLHLLPAAKDDPSYCPKTDEGVKSAVKPVPWSSASARPLSRSPASCERRSASSVCLQR